MKKIKHFFARILLDFVSLHLIQTKGACNNKLGWIFDNDLTAISRRKKQVKTARKKKFSHKEIVRQQREEMSAIKNAFLEGWRCACDCHFEPPKGPSFCDAWTLSKTRADLQTEYITDLWITRDPSQGLEISNSLKK